MTEFTLEHRPEYVIRNVHPESACAGQRSCPVHKMTAHHMRHFPQFFRNDRGLMERTCPHGIGHPDPDSAPYYESIGDTSWGVHGCDGCCRVTTSLPAYKNRTD